MVHGHQALLGLSSEEEHGEGHGRRQYSCQATRKQKGETEKGMNKILFKPCVAIHA